MVAEVYPDGDPIDWLTPWFQKHGIRDFKIGEILDRAARKNGYKDLYDYYHSMSELYPGQQGLTEAKNNTFQFQPCTLTTPELSTVLRKHYKSIFEQTGKGWYPHRCSVLAGFVTNSKKYLISENKSMNDLDMFLGNLKNYDQRSQVQISVGKMVSILQIIPHISDNLVEISGFVDPKQIKEIFRDDQDKIKWLEFSDGSTYPDQHFIKAGKGGGELEGTATLFYPSAQAAKSNLTALLLSVPQDWKSSTVNISEEKDMHDRNNPIKQGVAEAKSKSATGNEDIVRWEVRMGDGTVKSFTDLLAAQKLFKQAQKGKYGKFAELVPVKKQDVQALDAHLSKIFKKHGAGKMKKGVSEAAESLTGAKLYNAIVKIMRANPVLKFSSKESDAGSFKAWYQRINKVNVPALVAQLKALDASVVLEKGQPWSIQGQNFRVEGPDPDYRGDSGLFLEVYRAGPGGALRRAGSDEPVSENARKDHIARQTKDGIWRIFQTGNPVAVAGPFQSQDEVRDWFRNQKLKFGGAAIESMTDAELDQAIADIEAQDYDQVSDEIKQRHKELASEWRSRHRTPRDYYSTREIGKKMSESDISGLMSASHLNRSFIVTAETAEGQKKKYRVRAQSENVAREKFSKHYSQAEILNVREEGILEERQQPKKIEAYGVKGMKSQPWRKVFPSQEAFEKWLEKNEGNVEVQGTREAD